MQSVSAIILFGLIMPCTELITLKMVTHSIVTIVILLFNYEMWGFIKIFIGSTE